MWKDKRRWNQLLQSGVINDKGDLLDATKVQNLTEKQDEWEKRVLLMKKRDIVTY
jgi:hypothetical protein